jgi:hypothetical protein
MILASIYVKLKENGDKSIIQENESKLFDILIKSYSVVSSYTQAAHQPLIQE